MMSQLLSREFGSLLGGECARAFITVERKVKHTPTYLYAQCVCVCLITRGRFKI